MCSFWMLLLAAIGVATILLAIGLAVYGILHRRHDGESWRWL